VKRKTAIIDLDNVVYPFAEVMASIISGNTDVTHAPSELVQLYKSWAIWDDFGVPQGQFDWWWEQGVRSGAVWGTALQVPPIPGAAQALWELSDREWHIHIATSRMNKFRLHDTAAKNTVEWLAQHGIPYRSLSFTSDKHAIIADAIVDDSPDHLVGHNAGIKILFPSPHNLAWVTDRDTVNRQVTVDDTIIHVPVFDSQYGTSPWTEVLEILGDGRAIDSND
jgi:hypothetical protein